jgi:hypothetical protein
MNTFSAARNHSRAHADRRDGGVLFLFYGVSLMLVVTGNLLVFYCLVGYFSCEVEGEVQALRPECGSAV